MPHIHPPHGFLLQSAIRSRVQRLAEAILPRVSDAAPKLLLQRQRHQAFISTLAHELRQPISTIGTAVGILRGGAGSPELAKAVDVIERQTRQMNRLVEDLIESAQWARGAVLLRQQHMDLRVTIAETVSDASEAIAARGHHVIATHSPAPLWVHADPDRIRQVLTNLLGNAIKFTEPGGNIELASCRAGEHVVVTLKDTGRGFRPHELRHVFDLFSQVKTRDGLGGLGIGLNVVWQIVTLHRGRVEVRSDGPSRGSEFIVTLPAAT